MQSWRCQHVNMYECRKAVARPSVTSEDKNQIEHQARPRQASATAPLRTAAHTRKTGAGAGGRAGAET